MSRPTAAGEAASNKRDRIVAEAFALFAAHGLDAVTMNDIARAAGLTKATLYHYFASKDAIFRAILETQTVNADVARDVLWADDGCLEDRLAGFAAHLLAALSSPPQLLTLALRSGRTFLDAPVADDGRDRALREMLWRHVTAREAAVAERVADDMRGRGLDASCAPAVARLFCNALISTWMTRGLVARQAFTPRLCRQIGAETAHLCLAAAGLASPAARKTRGEIVDHEA